MNQNIQTYNRILHGANTKIYVDFTENMDVHPDTGDLFLITNENAIKWSLKNIILTGPYERFYTPGLGNPSVKSTLFRTSPTDLFVLQKIITNMITLYETRVQVNNVNVVSKSERALIVSINYTILAPFFPNQSLTINITKIG